MPQLRKRRAPELAESPPVKKTTPNKPSSVVESTEKGTSALKTPSLGDSIDLDGDFGGEIETNDGEHVTLRSLVEESQSGVVIVGLLNFDKRHSLLVLAKTL